MLISLPLSNLGKLMQPDFDQANFLYSMYKSCTVGEIEDFKDSLNLIRSGVIAAATRDTLTSKSQSVSDLARDLIRVEEQIRLKISDSVNRLDEMSLKIQHSLLNQVAELQA